MSRKTIFRQVLIGTAKASLASAVALVGVGCAATNTPSGTSASSLPSERHMLRLVKEAYAENERAMLARDLPAVLALRAPDFHSVTPDGRTHSAEQVAAGIRNLLATMVAWVALDIDLLDIQVTGSEVAVDTAQHTVRRQLRDGAVRRIENWVRQRETWVLTPAGLRLLRVDNLRDQCVLIDGKPRPNTCGTRQAAPSST